MQQIVTFIGKYYRQTLIKKTLIKHQTNFQSNIIRLGKTYHSIIAFIHSFRIFQ